MQASKQRNRLLLIPGVLLVVVVVLLPLMWILPISFGTPAQGAFTGGGFTLSSYLSIFTEPALRNLLLNTLAIAVIATAIATCLALPMAYFMSRSGPKLKSTLMVLVLFPLLVGTVVLSIGWIAILSPSGLINQIIQGMGLADQPLNIMRTPITVTVLIAFINMPYILVTLLSSLDSVGRTGEKAAMSMGASRARAFWEVTFPQIMPGVIAGTTLSFILAVNAYPTPVLIGSGNVQMLSPEIYQIITRDGNWPQGTSLAISVVVITLVIAGIYGSLMNRRFNKWRKTL